LADVSAERVHDKILARDAALLTHTVREAGALALSLFRTELKNWTKGASSPVSEADIRVNDLLEQRLRSATRDYGWLSEESVDDEARLGKRLVWIVDPIDGTRGYLAGREDWCVSVALVEDASPLLAAAMNFSLPRADRAPRATMRRFMQHRARSWIFPAWPGRSLWSNGSTGHLTKLPFIPV
jgi:3'-phosphoadenosine 5'-phosphosulfate (PAPS) 3'-phosphatase